MTRLLTRRTSLLMHPWGAGYSKIPSTGVGGSIGGSRDRQQGHGATSAVRGGEDLAEHLQFWGCASFWSWAEADGQDPPHDSLWSEDAD